MAEAIFGVVASGFAVASLALDLTHVAQKLHTFLTDFGQAGPRIERIEDNLVLFQTIGESVAKVCEENTNIECGRAVLRCLEICKRDTELLHNTIAHHVNGSCSPSFRRRKITTLKTVLKDKTIEKIETQLNADVTMLLLALQPFYHTVGQHQFDVLGAAVLKISGIKALNESTSEQSLSKEDIDNGRNYGKRIKTRESSSSLAFDGRFLLMQFCESHMKVTMDLSSIINNFVSSTGLTAPSWWFDICQKYAFRFTYSSADSYTVPGSDQISRKVLHTRLKVLLPLMSFHLQLSKSPWSLTYLPVVPCQSRIFQLCSEGDLQGIRQWFENRWISPFVVNQHGANLLHAETCGYLLQQGVDGGAYDDRLLTPLDHLARKLPPSFAYPVRVVDTIRALIERGSCQPLLPITSNAVAFYQGPEEGFAWLFNSEYGGTDLNEVDSEQWSLLGDAAFSFVWWCTKPGVDDEAAGWQSLYLLRNGASPHSENGQSRMTPLDAFLRGCTANSIHHASKWVSVVAKSGLDLHEYARKEQELHSSGHFLNTAWDDDLRKWVPTNFRVVFQYGSESTDLMIWIEDYDALGWFGGGKWDMAIFLDYTPMATLQRWMEINSRAESQHLEPIECDVVVPGLPNVSVKKSVWYSLYYQSRWVHVLALSLLVHYIFHLYIHKYS
ncbi:hypothetical protein HYFRA_00013850 [Hymenoscyphus fraxineus]|uniref:Fungal N-terminal domain-containing protein n=1 Tax=Hymenoscyphus fraxineus TaxID=746836 RepID=A0A9N9LC39_9HELO|nr:hypothetical protein HYFRA_00013850 [Hymenoscyphus fraxineus]